MPLLPSCLQLAQWKPEHAHVHDESWLKIGVQVFRKSLVPYQQRVQPVSFVSQHSSAAPSAAAAINRVLGTGFYGNQVYFIVGLQQ